MTADELLVVIRRDIGQQITMALQFRMSNHLAANMKIAREVEIVITDWLDALLKQNNLAGYKDGCYEGTREDWVARCYHAEAKLDKIKEILS